MFDHESDRSRMRRVAVRQMREQPDRREAIQAVGVFLHVEPVTQPGQHRQPPRQSQIQGVDRLDTQAARVGEQPPAVPGVGSQRCARQLAGACIGVARFAGRRLRLAQGVQYPSAHLSGRLARKRDREQRFRGFERREQRQATLDEELRLSGAGGRLYDKTRCHVERPVARGLVDRRPLTHRGSPVVPRAAATR